MQYSEQEKLNKSCTYRL